PRPSPAGRGGRQHACIALLLLSLLLLARTMRTGSCGAPRRGWGVDDKAAQRARPWMGSPFRAGRSPLEKPGPASRTCRAGARQAPTGVSFPLGYFSLTPGIHALRPSGRLRRSHVLLHARGQAKEKSLGRRQALETALKLARARKQKPPSPQPSPPTMKLLGERESARAPQRGGAAGGIGSDPAAAEEKASSWDEIPRPAPRLDQTR